MRLGKGLTAISAVLILAVTCRAETFSLKETAKKGECFRIKLQMNLDGQMQATRDGKPAPLKLSASASHEFTQRVLNVNDKGVPDKIACQFDLAQAKVAVGSEKSEKTLRDQRKLIVFQRFKDQPLSYCPAGPLTPEELELVGERFDTMVLTGLLPEESVAVGASWKLANPIAQALCGFEGLAEHTLSAKLDKADDAQATITVSGAATGIDLGAQVKLKVEATITFDRKASRITALIWKQEDEREQGPASPATKVKSTTKMERALVETPDNLTDAALVSVPDSFEPPLKMTALEFHGPKGLYDLALAREWQIVGQTPEHVILRLMENGDFVAQATITPWTKAEKGKHLSAQEFKDAASKTPGWEPETDLQSGEMPSDDGRWIYRHSAQGKMEDADVVQVFYLIAGPEGDQVVVAITMTPKQADRLGTRDVALVSGLVFPKKGK